MRYAKIFLTFCIISFCSSNLFAYGLQPNTDMNWSTFSELKKHYNIFENTPVANVLNKVLGKNYTSYNIVLKNITNDTINNPIETIITVNNSNDKIEFVSCTYHGYIYEKIKKEIENNYAQFIEDKIKNEEESIKVKQVQEEQSKYPIELKERLEIRPGYEYSFINYRENTQEQDNSYKTINIFTGFNRGKKLTIVIYSNIKFLRYMNG